MHIRLSKPAIGTEELKAIEEVLDSGWLAMGGGKVEEFEERLAKFVGIDHAVAVSSCTAGLHLAILAYPHEKVLVPDFTFPASANAVILAGGTPEFMDVGDDYNIKLSQGHDPEGGGLMVVHEFGLPADIDELKTWVPRDTWVIEDAACAFGAEYKGRKVGTLGDVAVFSFHATKILATGEGGMIVTNDDDVAKSARIMRDHGKYEGRFVELGGINYRMTELQAAIGIEQLKKLGGMIRKRKNQARYYNSKLKDTDSIKVPVERKGRVWQRYVLTLSNGINRDGVIEKLRKEGIEAAHGTFCLSEEPAFAPYAKPNPMARFLGRQALSLPIYPGLKHQEQDYVIEKLGEVLG